VAGRQSIGDARAKILGYLLGDGTLGGTSIRFTNTNSRLQDDFAECVEDFGGLRTCEEGSRTRARTVRIAADRETMKQRRERLGISIRRSLMAGSRSARSVAMEIGVSPASISNWCRGVTAPSPMRVSQLCGALAVRYEDLAPDAECATVTSGNGASAHEKFVPDIVFQLRPDELASFLNRLFATDGWASVLATGQSQLGYCTVSERMARQVQHLLLRFGVIGRLRQRRVRYQGGSRVAWQIDITDRASILTFVDQIGMFGKEGALDRVRHACALRRDKAFRDVVPRGVWRLVEGARGGASWSEIGAAMGLTDVSNLHVGRSVSRKRLQAIASAVDDSNLQDIATSDVYWDPIVHIEPVGSAQVYDLTVDGTHNFVANDVCVHNTAFCLNIAEYAAGECGIGVAVFSMEMSSDQLVMRMLCSQAEIDNSRVRSGRLHDRDIKNIALTAGKLGGAPIYIDDTAAQTVLEIRSKCRRLKHDPQAGLGLIIIDYLQLMRGGGEDNREQEISTISRSLKALAKELSVPIVALSQLNRQVEMRADKRPGMADLRESGALEQDADVIVFLYRDEQYNPDTAEPGVAEIIIAKQRNGPTGTVRLMFEKAFARFRNFSSREDAGAAYAGGGGYDAN
jgi:replicative DNA helicase